MKVVIQRVRSASVTINNQKISEIGPGMLILLGVSDEDNEEDLAYILKKTVNLRIFDDQNGVMNINIMDADTQVMVVSQFTLLADTKKGNRPSYIHAARPEVSEPMYEKFCELLSQNLGKSIQKGKFGANMQVELINDGPVTIIIDSKNR